MALKENGCSFLTFKDQVIFEKDEVLTQSRKPFSVFTSYKNVWLNTLHSTGDDICLNLYPITPYLSRLVQRSNALPPAIPSLADIGLSTNLSQLDIRSGMSGAQAALNDSCHA